MRWPPPCPASALHAEPWGETGSLHVRMALHTGVAVARDDDYYGAPLNRVARILAAGHGGQILLSLATEELVRDHLPPGATLHDLGIHQLKDLRHAEQIFQLVSANLPTDFPPLRTLDSPPVPAPVQPLQLLDTKLYVPPCARSWCRAHGCWRG
jgi:class 3 adenylate cyclase